MGLRERINGNKTAAIATILVLVGGAAGTTFWMNSGGIPAPLTTSYYSDDDGKSYFADETSEITPFDHNGKQAVRATVFRYGGGKPFVGYLARLNDSGRKRMEELRAGPPTQATEGAMAAIAAKDTEFKRPGDDKWEPIGSPAVAAILNPVPPPGETGDLTSVEP